MNRSYVSLRKVDLSSLDRFGPELLTPSHGGVGSAMAPARGAGSALSLSQDEMLSKEQLVMTAGHLGAGIAIGAFAVGAKVIGGTLLGGVGVALAIAGVGATWYFKNKEEA